MRIRWLLEDIGEPYTLIRYQRDAAIANPWTNGQVERMNRTIKEATVKAFHYPDFDALKAHVLAFVRASNFARHLKALHG